MSKYELMYIIGNHVSDDQIPTVVEEIKKFITLGGGTVDKQQDLGKKKLAYPIKGTKNGQYMIVTFDAPADKVFDIENRVRAQQTIVRYMIVNLDDDLLLQEKSRLEQAKMKPRQPREEAKPEVRRSAPSEGTGKIQIDLDAEIEKALESKDLK